MKEINYYITDKKLRKQLTQIAMNNSVLLKERGTLDKKWNDDDDFIELAIWSINQMLLDAYELGKNSK